MIFWITVAVAGAFASVVLRAAALHSRLYWTAFAVALASGLAILGLVIVTGGWWSWMLGAIVGLVGWGALDRAAARRGGPQR